MSVDGKLLCSVNSGIGAATGRQWKGKSIFTDYKQQLVPWQPANSNSCISNKADENEVGFSTTCAAY